MPIPPFNLGGVLPPYLGPEPGRTATQSPYRASTLELVTRFGTSNERIRILRGLLTFRSALRAIGIMDGIQWIDGSFVEDKERLKGHAPGDVDVITILRRPAFINNDQEWALHLAPHTTTLLDRGYCKGAYFCDTANIDLGIDPLHVAGQVAFWFSLFSHQRDTLRWKGIIQCELGMANADDAADVELRRRGG